MRRINEHEDRKNQDLHPLFERCAAKTIILCEDVRTSHRVRMHKEMKNLDLNVSSPHRCSLAFSSVKNDVVAFIRLVLRRDMYS